MRGGRLQRDARQPRGDAREQARVVHAAAAYEHALGFRLRRAQGVGDGGGAEFEQGRLHVGGRFIAGELRCQPVEVELFAAGGFGRRQREPRIVEQSREQGFVEVPARGEIAVRVVGAPAVAFAPGVHQRVRRAGVETAHRAMRRQQREVGDAAEVEHRAVLARRRQQGRVQRRQQRRAVAAGGDVAAAEIGDGGDPGAFGDEVAVAELQGERESPVVRGAVRAVAHGLAVRTERADSRSRDVRFAQQGERRVGEAFGHARVEGAEFVQRRELAALPEFDQPRAQRLVPGVGAPAHEFAARMRIVAVEAHQRDVDAVGAGAGNQAEEEGRHGLSGVGCWCPERIIDDPRFPQQPAT